MEKQKLRLPIESVVRKVSGLPFKSGFKTATIKGYMENPYTGRDSYTFEEDDSCVEIFRCKENKDEK